MKMTDKNFWAMFGMLLALSSMSCSHSHYKNLVGNDRDKHGCIASAGYQWSEVKKDCVRPWEVGEKFISGDRHIYVIFSEDSLDVELIGQEGHIICKKRTGERIWSARRGTDRIYFVEGEMMVDYCGVTYSREYKR